ARPMRAQLLLVGALLLAQACACSSGPAGTPRVDSSSGGTGPSGADASAGGGGGTTSPVEPMRDGGGGEVPAGLPPGVPTGYKLLLDQPFTSAGSLAAILAGNPPDWTHGDQDGGFLQYGGV